MILKRGDVVQIIDEFAVFDYDLGTTYLKRLKVDTMIIVLNVKRSIHDQITIVRGIDNEGQRFSRNMYTSSIESYMRKLG